MRFVADECVYGETVSLLRQKGYEVISFLAIGSRGADDSEVLKQAIVHDAVLITSDLDFGNILHYPPHTHQGIIVLRMSPQKKDLVHTALFNFLQTTSRESIRKTLVVVDSLTARIRR